MYIEIKDAVKQYGSKDNKVYALNHASLSIEKGEICVILGHSGSGKSTLLNMIGGLDSLDSGSIEVAGKNISSFSKNELALYRRNSVGVVFQFYNLIPDLTVSENIRVIKDISSDPMDMEKLMSVLEISKIASRFPNEISGGQQQRVAIARALAMEPKLLLLDEPTSALDPELVGEVLDTIKKAANEGYTMLLVSHEMSFVRNVATRVIFLDGGKILEDGTPREVFGNPKNERVKEFFTKINRMEEPDYSI